MTHPAPPPSPSVEEGHIPSKIGGDAVAQVDGVKDEKEEMMYGLKGLTIFKVGNSRCVLSPAMNMVWDGGQASADKMPTHDNMRGIWVTYSLPEAMRYSRHVFIVEGWGNVIRHESGFRSEYARVVAHVHAHPDDVEILDDLAALGIPTIMPDQMYEFFDPIGITSPDPSNNKIIVPFNMHLRSIDASNTEARILGTVDTIYVRDDAEYSQLEMRNAEIHHIRIPADKHVRIRGNGIAGRIDVGPRSRVIIHGAQGVIHITDLNVHPHAYLVAKDTNIYSANREPKPDDHNVIRYECQIGKEQEYFFLPVRIREDKVLTMDGNEIVPTGNKMRLKVHKSILPPAMQSKFVLMVRASATKGTMPREYITEGPVFPFALIPLSRDRAKVRDAAKKLRIPRMDVERALGIAQSPDVVRSDGIIVDRKGMMACMSYISIPKKVRSEWMSLAIYTESVSVHVPDGLMCNIRIEDNNIYELKVDPDAGATLAGSGYVYEVICTHKDAISILEDIQVIKWEA